MMAALSLYSLCCGVHPLLLQHYTLQCSTPCKTVTAACSWGLSDGVNTASSLSLICCCVQHCTTVCFGWHPLAVVTSSSSPCPVAVFNSMYNSDSSVFLAVPTGGSNTIFFTLSVVPLQCSTLHTTVTAVCSWRSLLVVVTPSSSPCLLFRCSAQLYVQQ